MYSAGIYTGSSTYKIESIIMIKVSKSENFLAKVAVMVVAMSAATACVAECSKPAEEPTATEKPEAAAE